MSCCMRAFIAAMMAATLFTQVAFAQHASPPAGPSDKEKAALAEKRAREKDIDEAYKSSLGRIPDSKQQNADPWGNLRAPK